MSRQVRIASALVAVIVATFAIGYGVAAQFAHPNLMPPGNTRYAFAQAEDPQTTSSASFVNVPNLGTTFTVPSGRQADVMLAFSGELNGCAAISVRAVVDGNPASPSQAQVFWPFSGSGAASHGFTFIARSVGSGSHNAVIQWLSLGGCDHAFISSRSMMLTANIH